MKPTPEFIVRYSERFGGFGELYTVGAESVMQACGKARDELGEIFIDAVFVRVTDVVLDEHDRRDFTGLRE